MSKSKGKKNLAIPMAPKESKALINEAEKDSLSSVENFVEEIKLKWKKRMLHQKKIKRVSKIIFQKRSSLN